MNLFSVTLKIFPKAIFLVSLLLKLEWFTISKNKYEREQFGYICCIFVIMGNKINVLTKYNITLEKLLLLTKK